MGIDLALTSRVPRKGLTKMGPKKVIEMAQAVFVEFAEDRLREPHVYEDEQGHWLAVHPHPCAEDIRVGVVADAVVLEARTSGVGPGYHQFVVSLADAMAKSIGLSWTGDDETGYFSSRDRGALEKAMLGFIGGLCRVVLERSPEDAGPLALSMPLGVRLKEDAFAVTPLGPRTREWIEHVRNNPAAGRDFFAWWDQKLSAKDLRNEALAHMWLDCRWAEPQTEAEARTVDRVLDLLARAHEMDAGLEMPWREWAELLAIAGETGPLRSTVDTRAAACPNARLVGYRRAERMEHMLPGGWTIEVPGSFSVEFEDEQATWIAWDHSRTVRVSSMCGMIPEGADLPPPSLEGLPPDAEPVARSVEGGRAAGFFSKQVEDGESFVALSGDVLVRRGDRLNIGLITITFSDPGHRAWALEVWESFQLMAEGDQGDEL